jgi:hypothetical protein
MTKAFKKIKEERVLFLSWVSDSGNLARLCAERLWTKLDAIPADRRKRPLTVRDLMELDGVGKAGDLVSDPAYYEALQEVTDVVNFFSDEFFGKTTRRHEKSAMSFFLDRKKKEGLAKELVKEAAKEGPNESDEDDEKNAKEENAAMNRKDERKAYPQLFMWGLSVQPLHYDDYPLIYENPHYWHYLADEHNPLQPDAETILRAQLKTVADTLLEHHAGECKQCSKNAEVAAAAARAERRRQPTQES